MATYITDAALKAACAGTNQGESGAALPSHWDGAVERGNRAAYRRLRAVLLNRGYTPAQIDAWDARVEWSEMLGVNRASWFATDDLTERAQLNEEFKGLLEQLAEEILEVDGEGVLPDVGFGRVGTGDYDTVDDIHTIDDSL